MDKNVKPEHLTYDIPVVDFAWIDHFVCELATKELWNKEAHGYVISALKKIGVRIKED